MQLPPGKAPGHKRRIDQNERAVLHLFKVHSMVTMRREMHGCFQGILGFSPGTEEILAGADHYGTHVVGRIVCDRRPCRHTGSISISPLTKEIVRGNRSRNLGIPACTEKVLAGADCFRISIFGRPFCRCDARRNRRHFSLRAVGKYALKLTRLPQNAPTDVRLE